MVYGSCQSLALLTWLLVVFLNPSQEEETLKAKCEKALIASQKFWNSGKPDKAHQAVAPLEKEARAQEDEFCLLLILNRRGQMWASLGHAKQAEKALREAVELAEALGEKKRLCAAIRWLYVAVNAQGRLEESFSLCERLLTLSLKIGDQEHQAWAMTGLAWVHYLKGESLKSKELNLKAINIFQTLGHIRSELWVRNSLGMVLNRLKAFEESKECYTSCAELAKKIGFLSAEANALNNLGCMEYIYGDPSVAEENFRRAYELQMKDKNLAMAIEPASNIVLCLNDLGRFKEAEEILTDLIAKCKERGYSHLEVLTLNRLAQVKGKQDRFNKSISLFEQALALNPAPDPEADSRVGLAKALNLMGKTKESLEVLEQRSSQLIPRLDPHRAQIYGYSLSKSLFLNGRIEEAHENFLELYQKAKELGRPGYQLDALTWAAHCEIKLEQKEQALKHLLAAASCWEKERDLSMDMERREHRAVWGQKLFVNLADLLIEHPPEKTQSQRISQAFEKIQQFKSRTLYERMMGPSGKGLKDSSPPLTLKKLQEEVLYDGELLLDVVVSSEKTVVLAITNKESRALKLPGFASSFGEKWTLFYELLSDPESRHCQSAAKSISSALMDGISDLLKKNHRIILAPDLYFHLIPLAGLYTAEGELLLKDHELMRIPSTHILSRLRSQPKGGGVKEILALFKKSEALQGAQWEVEHLQNNYEKVTLREDISEMELCEYHILHLAGHVVLDDQRPWRSGILSGALKASDIASMDLKARLAVLSGCGSAQGRLLSGEGIVGLTSAFLTAGPPVVIASLWPVDDFTTARLMKGFYSALSSGETVAGSLALAQRELREDPQFSHPFHWAGFVTIGDGAVTLPLEKKGGPWLFSGMALLFSLALVLSFFHWRRK